MSKIIIGIHGLGNKPDAVTLQKWWRASMEEGLKNQNKPDCKFNFELAYWSHLMHTAPLHPDIADPDDPLFIEDPYVPGGTEEPEENPRELRKKILHYLGNQLEHIFLKKDLTINFSSVNDFVIKHFFKDLAVYYDTFHNDRHVPDLQVKHAVRRRLAEVLIKHRKKRIMLIAHSMGSIVAFDVLNLLADDVAVDTLITIGSPLGIPIIRSKMAAEHLKNPKSDAVLRTPENVLRKWCNFTDLRDKIALYYELGNAYQENSHQVKVVDQTVINGYEFKGEKNPHKAYGYLKTPEVADAIDEFMQLKEPFAPLSWFRNLFKRAS